MEKASKPMKILRRELVGEKSKPMIGKINKVVPCSTTVQNAIAIKVDTPMNAADMNSINRCFWSVEGEVRNGELDNIVLFFNPM
tara:strand:+ start:15580 stop:15831 length:252 start_codon:yes stop_codon:yes gene_type:complete